MTALSSTTEKAINLNPARAKMLHLSMASQDFAERPGHGSSLLPRRHCHHPTCISQFSNAASETSVRTDTRDRSIDVECSSVSSQDVFRLSGAPIGMLPRKDHDITTRLISVSRVEAPGPRPTP
jgi:hypothetical protein